jgi:hypothetical protein
VKRLIFSVKKALCVMGESTVDRSGKKKSHETQISKMCLGLPSDKRWGVAVCLNETSKQKAFRHNSELPVYSKKSDPL